MIPQWLIPALLSLFQGNCWVTWGFWKFKDGTAWCWFKSDMWHIAGPQNRIVGKMNTKLIHPSLLPLDASLLLYVLAGSPQYSFPCFSNAQSKGIAWRLPGQWHPSWMPLGESLKKNYLACGSSDVSFFHDFSAQGSKKQSLLSLG